MSNLEDYSFRVVYRKTNGDYWTPWPSGNDSFYLLADARAAQLQLQDLMGDCETKIQRKQLPTPWEDVEEK